MGRLGIAMDHVEVMEQRGDLRATYSTVLKSFIGTVARQPPRMMPFVTVVPGPGAGILALPNAFSRGGVVVGS